MWKSIFLSLAAVLFVAGCFSGEAAEDGKSVSLSGTLRTGIVAIGGETTGTELDIKEPCGRFELNFGDDAELLKHVRELDGQSVTVTGVLSTRDGVEIKKRRVIAVRTIEKVVAKGNAPPK